MADQGRRRTTGGPESPTPGRRRIELAPPLWRLEALTPHVRHEDPEVRAWAASRLIHHYPVAAVDLVAPMLLDEASGMGEQVAEHLAQHGRPEHVSLLERAFRHGRGRVPGACLETLGRMGYEALEELAASATHRPELGESGIAAILPPLLRHGQTPAAFQIASTLFDSQPVLLVDPAIAREVFSRLEIDEYPAYVERLRAALAWGGADLATRALQGILEGLEVDDAGWLLHTDRQNRVELERTLKSYDATYDAETREQLGKKWRSRLRVAFLDGSLPVVAEALESYCRERAAELSGADPLPARLQALVSGLAQPSVLADFERLGPGAASQVVVAFLSCGLKLASFRSMRRELSRAGKNLDRLLSLAEVEGAAVADLLPEAIVRAAMEEGSRERVVRFAVETLGRRGPWHGRLVALELLGRLRAVEEAHEVILNLWDHHDAVLEAAGRALERMGPSVVGPVRNAYDFHQMEPAALEWMVAAVCQAGTREALAFMLDHLDDLAGALDPGFICDWASVLGAEELIPRFRDLLDAEPAGVGRALLLVSAIHNVAVPEEGRIHQAMQLAQGTEEETEGESSSGSRGGGGPYLM